MELREVEALLVLAEELHFGRAADRLGCSRARMSQLIRDLEREVGGSLFERTSRRVALTPLGERFRRGAGCGYEQLQRTLDETRLCARSVVGRLRVGYLPSIGGELATRLAVAFEERHPDCTVVLNAVGIGRTVRPEESLEHNDVVLCWSPGGNGRALAAPGLKVGRVLARTPRALLVPAGHPLTGRPAVRLDDLADYELLRPPSTVPPQIRDLWTPGATRSGRPLRHTARDMSELTGAADMHPDDMLTLVARGYGLHCTVATLLERYPFSGLDLITIEDMPPMAAVLVWRATDENEMIRAFAADAQRPGRP